MKISYLIIFLLPLLCNALGIDKTITINTGALDASTSGDAQATKRSSGSGSLNFLTQIKAGLISGLGRASAGFASSSSSSSSGYKSVDAQANSVEFDPWSLKKSVLNTLFQAVKAITGGVTAIKGQLIKGSGYAISAGGNLLAASGDKVTDIGKNIVSSAQLSPAGPAQPAQPVQHPFLTKFASLSGGSSSLSSQSAQSIDFDTHPSGESLAAYEIPVSHANYGPPPKAPTYKTTITKYIPTGGYTTGGGHTSGGGAQFTAAAFEDHHPSSLTFSKYGLPGEAAQTSINEHEHDQQDHQKYHPHINHKDIGALTQGNHNDNEDSTLKQNVKSNNDHYHLFQHHYDHDDHYHPRLVKENNHSNDQKDVRDHDHQNDQEFSHDHHDQNYIVGYKLSHDVNNPDHHPYKSRYVHYPITSQDHQPHKSISDHDHKTYRNTTDHDNYQYFYIDSDPHQQYNHNSDSNHDHKTYRNTTDHDNNQYHYIDSDHSHDSDPHQSYNHNSGKDHDHKTYRNPTDHDNHQYHYIDSDHNRDSDPHQTYNHNSGSDHDQKTYRNPTDHDNNQYHYIDSDHSHDSDPHQSYNHNSDSKHDHKTYRNPADHDNNQYHYIDSDHSHDSDPHQSNNHNSGSDHDHKTYQTTTDHNNHQYHYIDSDHNRDSDPHQSYNHNSDGDQAHLHVSHYQASHAAADNEYDHTHELLPHKPFGDWENYNQYHMHHSELLQNHETLTNSASHTDETHDNSTPHLGFSSHGSGTRYRQSTAELLKEIMPYIPKNNAKQPHGQKTTIVEQYVIPNDPQPLKTGPIHSISHTQSITTAFGQPVNNNKPSSTIDIDNAITLPSAPGPEPYDVYHTMNLKYGANKPSKDIGSTQATYIARPPNPTLDVSLSDNKYKYSTYITEVVPSIPLKPYHYSKYRPSHLNIGELVAALEARSDTKAKRHTLYQPMKTYHYRRPYQGNFYRRKYY